MSETQPKIKMENLVQRHRHMLQEMRMHNETRANLVVWHARTKKWTKGVRHNSRVLVDAQNELNLYFDEIEEFLHHSKQEEWQSGD